MMAASSRTQPRPFDVWGPRVGGSTYLTAPAGLEKKKSKSPLREVENFLMKKVSPGLTDGGTSKLVQTKLLWTA